MDKTSINTIVTIVGIIVTSLFGVIGVFLSELLMWAKLAICLAILLVVVILIIWILQRRKKQLIKDCLDNKDFREYWLDRTEGKPYVAIEYQKTSPAEYDEPNQPNEKVERYSLTEAFVEDFFSQKHRGSTYAAILGDSGSGKTTALVNLLIDYINHYGTVSLPYHIRLFNMGNKDVWNEIEKFFNEKDKGKYILLLDALDENEEAQEKQATNGIKDYKKKVLEERTKGVARVVVTCRPQFFRDEKSEPDEIDRTKGVIRKWERYYVSPFSKAQVGSYLTQKFGVPDGDPRHEKARKIVFGCPLVFCRPLILSWIDELVDLIPDSEKLSVKEVYKQIIAAWILRESDGNEEKAVALYAFSYGLAVFMYIHGINKVNEEQYRQFQTESKMGNEDYMFRERSLLTRGTDGGYKFSHKSFYEYFLAQLFFQQPDAIDSVQGLDFAVRIFDELYEEYQTAGKHPEEDDARVAMALRNLGYKLEVVNHLKEAEKESQKALALYRELAGGNKDFDSYVAMVLNDLAVLHYKTNQHDEAEAEYAEALGIYRDLAEKNPEAFLPYVAGTLNNLANLHGDIQHYQEAEKEFAEALDIRRTLAEKNLEAFLPDVAGTLNNLASLHSDTQHYQEAEKEYAEALDIRRDLAEKHPEAFLPYVATTLNNLAVLHYQKAESEFAEALGIRRNLAEKNPEAFLPDMADTLFNMALTRLHMGGDLRVAEEEAQESLEHYQTMAELSPEAFGRRVEAAKQLLEAIRSARGNNPQG